MTSKTSFIDLDKFSLYKRKRVDFIYEKIVSKLENPRILDVGCGNGKKLAKILIEKGVSPSKYYGIDIQEKELELIKKLKVNAYKKDLSDKNLSFKSIIDDKKFDVVLIIEVLEHFKTLNEKKNILLQSIYALENGKHLAMTFPSHPGIDTSNEFGHKNKVMNTNEILEIVEEKFNKIQVFYDKVTYAIICFEKISE
jgi:2-polyprenyl-3-methyl-5-hydroxy-6-metoxy-1,4-benzoquinol methylase